MLASTLTVVSAFGLVACQDNQTHSKAEEKNNKPVVQVQTSVEKKKQLDAKELAKKYIITDTHIDVPMRLSSRYEDVAHSTEHGEFDYPRAVEGGLDAPFMSIYIPANLQKKAGASYQLANELIDMVEELITKNPKKYAKAYTSTDVENNFAKGLISLPMGMENGSPIEGKIENLQHFYNRGIRYITLAHSKANHISDSSYDKERPAKGLTDFGKKLVLEMNKIGMMVDISHVSDDAFYQVMEISQVPVIASHSSARHFTPGFERNMSDDMIKLLAKKGGVIQINFGSTFVSQSSIENYDKYKAAREIFMAENNLERNSDEVKAFAKQYREKTPFQYAKLNDVLDHYDHVIKLTGIDHVGIGSDYDGVGDSLPEGLKDVATYPNLIQGFIDRGYSEKDIAKILSGNLMRVWKQTEAYAAKHQLTN